MLLRILKIKYAKNKKALSNYHNFSEPQKTRILSERYFIVQNDVEFQKKRKTDMKLFFYFATFYVKH